MGEYFDNRIKKQLGITDKENKIKLSWTEDETGLEKSATMPIFSEDKEGNIKILVYSIDGKLIQYDNKNANLLERNVNNNRDKHFYITRLKNPKIKKDNNGNESEQKYDIPSGIGTYPFFSPLLVEAFKKKTHIKTLVLTEGYFKAFKGCKHGIPVVGLSSITHYKQKDTEKMYVDVLRIIEVCKVKNIIVLYDGDCLDISRKAFDNKQDLTKRPYGFINSCKSIRDLLKDTDVDVYFSHINTSEIETMPKGLDDLFVLQPDDTEKIVTECMQLTGVPDFFTKFNISSKEKKLFTHFALESKETFHAKHAHIIGDKEFNYHGTIYQRILRLKGDQKQYEIKEIKPLEADNYFRVGDNYYEFVWVPDRNQNLMKRFDQRMKGTIKDDFGKEIFEWIPKYKSFCNVADHINFQQVLHNCFNVYFELPIKPDEGDCELSIYFVKHIFGEQWEMGLDYIQLLFQRPTQVLPILCLVSKENKTGKSTFINWLKAIFGENAALLSNNDFAGDFNFHWATKLILACEESFLDKKAIVERIKQLATANKISMNRKGKDAGEVEFIGKFILASNNEENFIIASENDIRYWVHKIPVLKKEDPFFQKKLYDEIPQFLNFLNNRKMSYPVAVSRMWFPEAELITEAFKRLVNHNLPSIIKEIRTYIRNTFLEFGAFERYNEKVCMMLTMKYIHEKICKSKFEYYYLENTIKQYKNFIKYEPYLENGEPKTKRFKIPVWKIDPGIGEEDNCKIEFEKQIGKPWVFFAKDYLSPEELSSISVYESEKLPF
ncbi:MAG: primase-helicase family protein [Lutibacter sp.]|jgi:hypothetical protein